MQKARSMWSLETLGRVRLSKHFYMRDFLYSEIANFHQKQNLPDNPDLAIRHERWKYYVNFDGSDRQLYDLETDLSESKNLIDDHPDVAERLHRALGAWNATMPKDTPVDAE